MVLSKAARCSWTLSDSSSQAKKLHWIKNCCCWSLSFLLYIFHFCFKGMGKIIENLFLSSCCSVTKLGPALCDPMTGSMPGFPVLHHLPVCSNSCTLSHPTISSSITPFSSCPQSSPASGSFLMSQLFTSGGQSIGASASPSSSPWIFRVDFL